MAELGESSWDETQAELAKQVRLVHAALGDSVPDEMVRLVHKERKLVRRVWARLEASTRADLNVILTWCYRCKAEKGPHRAVWREVRSPRNRFPTLQMDSVDPPPHWHPVKRGLCSWDDLLYKRELVCAGLEKLLDTLDTGRRVRADGGQEVPASPQGSHEAADKPEPGTPDASPAADYPADEMVGASELLKELRAAGDSRFKNESRLREYCEANHVHMTRPAGRRRKIHRPSFERACRKQEAAAQAEMTNIDNRKRAEAARKKGLQ